MSSATTRAVTLELRTTVWTELMPSQAISPLRSPREPGQDDHRGARAGAGGGRQPLRPRGRRGAGGRGGALEPLARERPARDRLRPGGGGGAPPVGRQQPRPAGGAV